ncbi:ABC transporter permease [Salisediminibacterium halotolerans]|uniref:Simple sugar transport system permease protein n=1 Tax=Salisediminibacterium halotolerans TaxID=517425 RepID=A0A1H9TLU1_9BACI|nr:ABC transporter permease [Salisediminibacterium haloalkalitolerans]SER98092.1 simple sugar transport system permease protein [Salisediminibacterium haloalkalitolerans]
MIRDFLRSRAFGLVIPLIAVAFGLIAGAVIMLLSGNNPIDGYSGLIGGIFGDMYYFGETLRAMTPLILSGLAFAFAFRTGLLNIGVEGQVIVGWFAAVIAGISWDAPGIIHLPTALMAGALAGALWAFVPGILKAKLHVHEVIVSIMMNYIALHVVNSLIRGVFLDTGQRTAFVPDSASLSSEWLQGVTDFSRLHWGFLIALAAAVVMWFLLWKTKKGFEFRAVGFNQNASLYAGMNVSGNITSSMSISGAFAGLAGAVSGLGTYGYIEIFNTFTNLGFDGIAVALLGNSSSIGIVLSAFLFGGLSEGSGNMQAAAGVAPELVEIIIALIIFFVASSYLIRWIYKRLDSIRKGEK